MAWRRARSTQPPPPRASAACLLCKWIVKDGGKRQPCTLRQRRAGAAVWGLASSKEWGWKAKRPCSAVRPTGWAACGPTALDALRAAARGSPCGNWVSAFLLPLVARGLPLRVRTLAALARPSRRRIVGLSEKTALQGELV